MGPKLCWANTVMVVRAQNGFEGRAPEASAGFKASAYVYAGDYKPEHDPWIAEKI
ncbi:hypothetical protein EGR_02250 [Echinococcus granulosus]|uniref:Uncharacterized protein n=1 Tax=Echinococcus granulosus TaxID=6210 RepID=W6V8H0_ECHGR|nr:hypothetical protein EGR_02250 [Echinococcus granulosus]EUB62809.1 hypothetical protein EGR_02250 [Echinococcus granulosus]